MASSASLTSLCFTNFTICPTDFSRLRLILYQDKLQPSKYVFSQKSVVLRRRVCDPLLRVPGYEIGVHCFAESIEGKNDAGETFDRDGDSDDGENVVAIEEVIRQEFSNGAASPQRVSGDSLSLGIRDPVYEVVEVRSNGMVSTRKINRRNLLKSSGLRPRDIRSVDPSLWLTNSMPSLLVREYAILLNLGTLRAIAMQECVYIFNYNRLQNAWQALVAYDVCVCLCLNPWARDLRQNIYGMKAFFLITH